MELRVIDFDSLTRNFQPYIDGYLNIEAKKREMLDSVQPLKKEMESILARSRSGLIVDEISQQNDMNKFQEIQSKLMEYDSEFKRELKNMQEDLNTDVYDQLSIIISEWANSNGINLVMGKMEVIFNTDDIDATNSILDIIRERDLLYAKDESNDSVEGELIQPSI